MIDDGADGIAAGLPRPPGAVESGGPVDLQSAPLHVAHKNNIHNTKLQLQCGSERSRLQPDH